MDPTQVTVEAAPTDGAAAAQPPAAAAAAPAAAALHDQLRVAFEGDAAMRLEELGVSAFDSSEVERNILHEAIADDEKKATAEATRAAAEAAAASSNSTFVLPPRRLVKKKSSAVLGQEKPRERESSLVLPVPKARERIVHPNEGKHAAASRGFRGSSSAKSKQGSAATGLGLSRARASDGESVIERAAQSGTLRDGEEARLERQRAIEHGEATPFANVGGLSKEFARVHTQRILPPGGALMARPPVPIAAAAAASARQPTTSISHYSSPFPRAEALAQAPRASPAKAKSATKRASTAAAASASPTPAAARSKKTKTKRTVKRAKRESISSSDASDNDFAPRVKSEKKAVQPWVCESCTFLNPSDFSRRCDVCHTVRTKSAAELAPPPALEAAAAASSPLVKLEPGGGPSRDFIELSSDADSAGVDLSKRKPSKLSRKRKVKSEPGVDDMDSDASAEVVKEEEEEEWRGDAESSSSSSSSSSSDDGDDAVDAALKDEDSLVDDDDDDIDEEAVAATSARGGHRHRRSRHHILHDDYEDWSYEERVEAWKTHRENELEYAAQLAASNPAAAPPADANLDVAFDGGYILPAYIWNKLFAYQKTCIKWMWELHAQGCGGIIADEMGLGKTIQVLAFLAGLHYSAQHSALNPSASGSSLSSSSVSRFRSLGPTLIIVPATIMSQWLREFQEWYPEMRVVVLHDSVPHDARVSKKQLVEKVFQAAVEGQGTVLITTYQSIHGNKHLLLPREWGYVILDEGHKIRNPDAAVTLLCKQFLSVHRLILTGSPISNHLTELWSLFDFVFPGKLGTLPVFEDEFASPILNGGYTSATPVQIQLAYKCALILRDLINPYILRRCLSGDTLVETGSGFAQAIRDVAPRTQVLSFDAAQQGHVLKPTSALLDQGTRSCVELLFSDGRTVTCTPDHRFLDADGRTWIEAQHMKVDATEITAGMQHPTLQLAECDAAWILQLGDELPALDMTGRRGLALAFAGLLGFLLSAGSVCANDSVLFMGHSLDVQWVQRDIHLLTGCNVAATPGDHVMLPAVLHRSMMHVGVRAEERLQLTGGFPAFLLAADCPAAVVQAFLGGLFGGDGNAPSLCWKDGRVERITELRCSCRRKGAVQAQAGARLSAELQQLIARVGMPAHSIALKPSCISANSQKSDSLVWCIPLGSTLAFAERIGFRYSCHKQMRLTAAAAYYRMRTRLEKGELGMSIDDALREWDALKFFGPETSDESPKVGYGVPAGAQALPTFRVKLIGRRELQEPVHVWDLTVPGTENFVAQGLGAHNCKADVAQHLPPKTEQVLFCNLTPEQHAVYQQFLDQNARDIADIVKGKMSLFRVIHYLRKIANHPDLLQLKIQRKTVDQNGRVVPGKSARQRRLEEEEDDRMLEHPLLPDYGSVNRSGKMQVVQQVLRMWKLQGHRCLLFSQTRQMLDILEKFVRGEGYNYRRVDGSTSIKTRMPIIDEFNKDPNIFIMLITTRAGGLGVNLVGADRVILYDPDWNPQSDMQAKERAYRIGQSRSVTVYRLITRGCIEEKVYHRQIWKQFLTDKVLKDPKQKRFFSNHDIKDLFSLAPLTAKKGAAPPANETGAIFQEGVIKPQDVIEADAEERRREMEALRPAPVASTQGASSVTAAKSAIAESAAPPVVVKSEPLEDGEVTMEDADAAAAAAAASTESKDSAGAAAAEPAPRDRFFSDAPVDSPVKARQLQAKQEPPDSEDPMPDVTFPPLEIEDYASDTDAAPRDRDDHAQSTADDNRILAALFSKSGLQSAMNHDVILNSSSQEEKHLVASLAQKVADRAVAALKASRQKMKDQPVNAPTWTGRSGTSGAPSFVTGSPQSSPPPAAAQPKPKFGASSRKPALFSAAGAAKEGNVLTDAAVHEGKLRAASFGGQTGGASAAAAASSSDARHFDSSVSGFALTSTTAPASLAHKLLNTGGASSSALLLQRMRNRSHVSSVMASHTGMPDATVMELDGTAGSNRSVLSGEAAPADKSASLLSSLRALLLSRPDGVSSDELISTFGPSIGSGESDKLVFRQMLRRVAELHGKKKHARWKIKPEFD